MRQFSALAGLAATDLAIGFGIQILVLISVGVGSGTDAYYAGQAPPIVLLAILQLPLQRAVVASYGKSATGDCPALLLIMTTVGSTLLVAGLLSWFGPIVISSLYQELPFDAHATAVTVLRLQSLTVSLTVGNVILLSLNHLDGRFIQCEAALITSSLFAALFVFLTVHTTGVVAAAHGQLLKALMSGGIYLLILRRRLSWGSPPWREIWQVIRPLTSAGALTKLAPIIDRSIASAAPSGSMTMLTFAQAMYGAANGIAERAVVAPRLPDLKQGGSSVTTLAVAVRLAVAGGVIAALLIGFMSLAREFDLLSGLVDVSALTILIALLACLIGFPIAALSVQWMAGAMVILGRSDLSAKIVTWGFVASVSLKLAGFYLGGIYGLAVAVSCYYLANAAAFAVALRSFASTDSAR